MRLHLFIIFSFLFFANPTFSQKITSLDNLFSEIRKEYSGETALATTAYVGQRWRLPGNKGFNESIYYVRDILEKAGFVEETKANGGSLIYRLERRSMLRPTWDPINASLQIVGDDTPILQFSSNRNMITINSYSTPAEGVTAEVVFLNNCNPGEWKEVDLKGKIAFGECHCGRIFEEAVKKRGAIGVLGYRIPHFNQPEKYTHSIPFTSISLDTIRQSWAINLSFEAKEALKKRLENGTVRVKVNIETKIYKEEELTLVAEIKGSTNKEERFVFSAHIQEPGANDNASGVGCLAEMARVAAKLTQSNRLKPNRTLTFLWGDEIRSTYRFVTEDESRLKGIKWGVSLDMVGENTAVTGGTFLIEKMPDPSALWTRGEDKHSEWGASEVKREALKPHYFNDYILDMCLRQAADNDWVVNTNPYEGGSDHVPFLRADIPGLLLWHFTDVFYHTDADRIDKVSPQTLFNVGVSALASAINLVAADKTQALRVLKLLEKEAKKRLDVEFKLSKEAIAKGKSREEELEIIKTWSWWYSESVAKVVDIPLDLGNAKLKKQIKKTQKTIQRYASKKIAEL